MVLIIFSKHFNAKEARATGLKSFKEVGFDFFRDWNDDGGCFPYQRNLALVYGDVENEGKNNAQFLCTVFQYSSTHKIGTTIFPSIENLDTLQNGIFRNVHHVTVFS